MTTRSRTSRSRSGPSRQDTKAILKPLLGAGIGGVATVLAMRHASPIGRNSDIPTPVQWGPYAAAVAVLALTYKNPKLYGMAAGAAFGAVAGAAVYASENAAYFEGRENGVRSAPAPRVPGQLPGQSPTGTLTSPFRSGALV